MNLLQQLEAAQSRWPNPVDVPQYKEKRSKPMKHANEAKRAITIQKYRDAMRGTWTDTATIARRLGYVNSASCHGTLVDYEALGLVERRFAGGEGFNRRKGYEWRFKDEA